jgi:hypothetical protein
MVGDEPTKQVRVVLERFNAALARNDIEVSESYFFSTQVY